MSEGMHLILAAYQSTDAANDDFERLVGRIGSGDVSSDGVILVRRDDDGRVSVVNTREQELHEHLAVQAVGQGAAG